MAPIQPDDHLLAADLAEGAGQLLVALRSQRGFSDPSGLRATGDREAHLWLVGALTAQRPQDIVLSEEATDDMRRLDADRVWIIDPLDGTREYGEEGRADWAVHVALSDRYGQLLAGAVALPAHDVVMATRPAPVLGQTGAETIVLGSRSRPTGVAAAIAEAVSGRLSPMGSAGAKAMAVVQGRASAYVHAGGMYQWDSAAPVAVAAAAGLHVSRLDGSPLVYNQPDLLLPDLLICRTELADQCLAAAAAFR